MRVDPSSVCVSQEDAPPRAQRWSGRTAIAVGLLWLAALAYYLSQRYLHHDVSWVLVATGRMLDGARLYRDVIGINPPLIFYSAAPAVMAAWLTGWPASTSFELRAGGGGDAATRQRLVEVERFIVDAVIEDLQRNHPEIVLVDLANPYFDGPPFDYLEFFGRDPRFQALWRDYVKTERVDFVERVGAVERNRQSGTRMRPFDVYCRRGAAPGCAG